MEAFLSSNRIGLGFADIPFGLFIPSVLGVPVVLLPRDATPLERMWAMAHELGHAILHSGAKSEWSYTKGEAQANRWAASALIPNERIQTYLNACEDSMVAALSAHYEDIPLIDCSVRRLAGRIARIRLQTLSTEVA